MTTSEADRPSADSRDFDAPQAEVADLKTKLLAAVSVLLEFAGRLGVGDDELADLLADAQMRAEARP